MVILSDIIARLNSFFQSCIFKNYEFRCIFTALVIETRLRILWGPWCSLVHTVVFQLLQLVEYLVQLLLALILSDCSLDDCDCAVLVHEVGGTRSTAWFTQYSSPILFEIRLDQLKTVESWHFGGFTWSLRVVSLRASSVVGRVLVLAIVCRFSSWSGAIRSWVSLLSPCHFWIVRLDRWFKRPYTKFDILGLKEWWLPSDCWSSFSKRDLYGKCGLVWGRYYSFLGVRMLFLVEERLLRIHFK